MTTRQIEARQRELNRLWADRNGGEVCGCAKLITPEEQREYEELSLRRMIISDFCYGGASCSGIYDERTGRWHERYGYPYAEKIGFERALEVFKEQRAFLQKHATVHYNVHTDHEGCSYNSISWDVY
jgi:hypothetical protein